MGGQWPRAVSSTIPSGIGASFMQAGRLDASLGVIAHCAVLSWISLLISGRRLGGTMRLARLGAAGLGRVFSSRPADDPTGVGA